MFKPANFIRALAAISLLVAGSGVLAAASRDRPQRPFTLPFAMAPENRQSVSLFDGSTLAGWRGDPRYWRVENGDIVGEVTPATLLKDHNSFLIWQGGSVGDFDLDFEYRISSGGNSGLNYRSEILHAPNWTMRGYQFDIVDSKWAGGYGQLLKAAGLKIPSFEDPKKEVESPVSLRGSGQNYDELGRHVLALPGEFSRVGPDSRAHVIGLLGDENLVQAIERDGWNHAEIIARGPLIIHLLNDRVISVVEDDDPAFRHRRGHIGIQVHAGPPMKVEFRNIRLRRFD